MTKSFLSGLYFGNLAPWERRRPQDPYDLLTRKISDMKTHFQSLLPPDALKAFEEMRNMQAQAGAIEEAELFEYAFCMAMLLMMDVFAFKEKQFSKND